MVTLQIINKTANSRPPEEAGTYLKESVVKNLVETREEVDPAILIEEVKIESGRERKRKKHGRC